jgi:hypothetical protein
LPALRCPLLLRCRLLPWARLLRSRRLLRLRLRERLLSLALLLLVLALRLRPRRRGSRRCSFACFDDRRLWSLRLPRDFAFRPLAPSSSLSEMTAFFALLPP